MVKKKIDDDDEDQEPEEVEESEEEIEEEEAEPEQEEEDDDDDSDSKQMDEKDIDKPEKVGNIDSLVFLKEYAKDINRQYTYVASKLGIAKSSAFKYLQKYLYLTKETINDPDFPRRAKLVLNKNVPDKYHLTDDSVSLL
jgi:hypothetical protein